MDHTNSSTKAGTIGGTLLVLLINIFSNDIIRTIGFAALGATASFFVSLFWNALLRYFQRRQKSVARRGSGGGDPHQQ